MKGYIFRLQSIVVSALSVLSLFIFQSPVLACACCAAHGEWFEFSHSISRVEVQSLNRVQFAEEAKTYIGPGGLEDVPGIAPSAETYRLSAIQTGLRWRWTLTDAAGNTGVLAFNIPNYATSFGTDLRDGVKSGAGGPLLYKEWRMRGRVWGNGVFAAGMNGQPQFHLIFQGRGNRCMTTEDWRHWRLEVRGQRANFTLYGGLQIPSMTTVAPLYFSSPDAAIPVISALLRKEDWTTLSRYYDLSGTDINRSELESGRFFLRTERPADSHPGLWRYKHPFAPGYEFQGVEDVAELGVVQVSVIIEIDQSDGTIQRGISDFLMRKSKRGYQILPPREK